jgi:hypothetical protein
MLQNAKQLQHAQLFLRLVDLCGFDQHYSAKFLFGAEHHQSLETALNNVG